MGEKISADPKKYNGEELPCDGMSSPFYVYSWLIIVADVMLACHIRPCGLINTVKKPSDSEQQYEYRHIHP